MWMDKRYTATRDASRGGLRIVWTCGGISEEVCQELDANCLELICTDYDTPALAVYPLKDHSFSVAMGQKVAGSSLETRPHEVIRGLVMNEKEFDFFNRQYLADGKLQDIFWNTPIDPEWPAEWEVVCPRTADPEAAFRRFMNRMDYQTCLGLYQAVRTAHQRGLHIRIDCSEEEKLSVMAALCAMALSGRLPLFIMADGECTLRNPDILFCRELNYLDPRIYQVLTFEQLIRMGKDPKFLEDLDEKSHASEEPDPAVEASDYSVQYIESEDVSEYEVYEKVQNLIETAPSDYRRFLRILRVDLDAMSVLAKQRKRYLKMLMLAFPNPPAKGTPSAELTGAPYDFEAIYGFLKDYCISRRELRKFVADLMEIQVEICSSRLSGPERALTVRRGMRNRKSSRQRPKAEGSHIG